MPAPHIAAVVLMSISCLALLVVPLLLWCCQRRRSAQLPYQPMPAAPVSVCCMRARCAASIFAYLLRLAVVGLMVAALVIPDWTSLTISYNEAAAQTKSKPPNHDGTSYYTYWRTVTYGIIGSSTPTLRWNWWISSYPMYLPPNPNTVFFSAVCRAVNCEIMTAGRIVALIAGVFTCLYVFISLIVNIRCRCMKTRVKPHVPYHLSILATLSSMLVWFTWLISVFVLLNNPLQSSFVDWSKQTQYTNYLLSVSELVSGISASLGLSFWLAVAASATQFVLVWIDLFQSRWREETKEAESEPGAPASINGEAAVVPAMATAVPMTVFSPGSGYRYMPLPQPIYPNMQPVAMGIPYTAAPVPMAYPAMQPMGLPTAPFAAPVASAPSLLLDSAHRDSQEFALYGALARKLGLAGGAAEARQFAQAYNYDQAKIQQIISS